MSVSISQIIILLVFVGGPLFYPLLTRKWAWSLTVILGYLLYGLWGWFLHSTSDITEYGTGYGMFIVPYLIIITMIGAFIQRKTTK
ncbi:hypothetical protein [Lysinibacillus endophyticus]|uniref:Uncharacterized protein n=1 Tax=Ureibacillus endophyticus TaxID=1978490 RepID=A0A494ZAL6_9BACL|nr:hypothetical protein [Lysinibacillus endophyticus]RKQ19099.1 hypothetical protein D8M03_04605 [Lysinibacillus endophyticus]